MADFVIDLGSLDSKKSTLDTLNNGTDTIFNTYTSSSVSSLKSTEVSTVANRVSSTMDRLKNGYSNSLTWFSDYLSGITSLEASLASFEGSSLNTPVEFKGTFEDIFGKVTMPVLKTGADTSLNVGKFIAGARGEGTVLLDVLGNTYVVADTEAELMEYYNNIIRGKDLYQDANYKIYKNQCLGFAYNYAWGLYTNNTGVTGSQCRNETDCATQFKQFRTNNESEFLSKIYEEVSAGRPVVVQVIGSRSNKTRHYVTVVGFDSDVKSAKDLKSTDLLIVDSFDGKMKNTVPYGASSGRYIAKGTQINKGSYPYGYDLYYIKT